MMNVRSERLVGRLRQDLTDEQARIYDAVIGGRRGEGAQSPGATVFRWLTTNPWK